jgi:hypothetical protein
MAHCNTIFHQMLKLIPRHHFAKLEAEHGTGRQARSFTRWSQLVHLISMQLTARVSLRDGIASLKARLKNLYHLGVKPVARSTFADANNKRPASFFAALFAEMYRRCQPVAPKHKFKFKNKLYSLDATTVSLCLSLFPWASFRRTKAGVKLHTLLDHGGYLPAFVAITPAGSMRSRRPGPLTSPKVPSSWRTWAIPTMPGMGNSPPRKSFLSPGRSAMPAIGCWSGVPSIPPRGWCPMRPSALTGAKGRECPKPLRRIVYQDPETGKVYVFLTNHFRLAAKTIADIYKERWQIEIFFRFIKQNLKIKAFIGNSENAVMSQIYAALIVYLLLCYTKFLCNLNVALQHFMRVLQLNLFRTCPLPELFEPPGPAPDNMNVDNQLCLVWA